MDIPALEARTLQENITLYWKIHGRLLNVGNNKVNQWSFGANALFTNGKHLQKVMGVERANIRARKAQQHNQMTILINST